MSKTVAFLLFFLLSLALQGQQAALPALPREGLLKYVQANFTPREVLGYGPARDIMYSQIDLKNDTVYGIYTGHALPLPPGEDPSQALYRDGSPDGINCEHVYPRSKGAKSGPAKSDMHHLFPSRVAVNAIRGNNPFGEVPDEGAEQWLALGFEQGSVPTAHRDAYSEAAGSVFEPREAVKGDIARAVFYFYTIYRKEALQADPLFFQGMRPVLLQWHLQDPPDAAEVSRTYAIARYQDGKPNPFVVFPELAFRLYGE
ncbi:endonuclease I family protein [Phaeodactylibacter luteus]|uniref:Endonuclease I n=1 Tax=Phaeodactylibacter luteus TaxID=1564516 RepID=A0A5C6RWL8_9BACT|nr:endonuclease [Phaeodactylibacter luteus]TXB66249.1 endonuclease I [Phaeodactylibacter luteus]